MDEPKKIHKIGGTAVPTSLSIASLVTFAEAVIRHDKEAALRSQQGVDDLVAPAQDSRQPRPVQLSSLESLCGVKGKVKVQSENTPAPKDNIVSFGTRKKS